MQSLKAGSWERDSVVRHSQQTAHPVGGVISLRAHSHLFLNREGRWGTTDDFATSFLHFFPVLNYPLGLAELQACPFPDVVFPPLPVSALSSSPFHCALKDGFGQT